MAAHITFSDLDMGERFEFADRRGVVCEKVGRSEYEVVETGQFGMVGAGDNPVEPIGYINPEYRVEPTE